MIVKAIHYEALTMSSRLWTNASRRADTDPDRLRTWRRYAQALDQLIVYVNHEERSRAQLKIEFPR